MTESIAVVSQPLYSSDLIFLRIQKAVTNTLKDFTDKDFQQCFQRWKECLEWCVASEGNYLGGDHIEM